MTYLLKSKFTVVVVSLLTCSLATQMVAMQGKNPNAKDPSFWNGTMWVTNPQRPSQNFDGQGFRSMWGYPPGEPVSLTSSGYAAGKTKLRVLAAGTAVAAAVWALSKLKHLVRR